MSAVSPGPEEACPGSVWPPLLCTLLQAAHQVDWWSSDRPQPCEMQTLPLLMLTALSDMLQHILCSYICSPLGILGTRDQLLSADSSFKWLDSNVGVSESRIWPMLTHSKGVHFLFPSFILSLIHWLFFFNECIENALVVLSPFTLCLAVLYFCQI